MKRWIISILFLSSVNAFAKDTFYVILLGYNDKNNDLPSLSHTFATFVKRTQLGEVIARTISFIADDDEVRPLAVQPGHNLNLKETMRLAGKRQVQHYGPYESTEQLFTDAGARIDFLVKENLEYKMFDFFWRDLPGKNKKGGAVNCIHAVSDLRGFLDTEDKWGIQATAMVRDHFKNDLIRPEITYQEVLRWVGL